MDAKGNKIGRALDFLAASWACVKGNMHAYLMVSYYNGGSCEECEWYEIYNLNGGRLATSRGKVTSNAYKNFEKVYKQLGLPKQWPKPLFIDIPLSKNNK